MKKILIIGLGLTLLSACLYPKKLDHPLMDNPAFDVIGDQGYKQDITFEELQGEYDCDVWILDEEGNQDNAHKISCTAQIVEHVLSIEWQMNGMDTAFTSPPFKLEQALLFSEEDEPSFISAVKVYPDGHMIDGVGTLFQDNTELRIHFQMTK
jgi:hypothetical protein